MLLFLFPLQCCLPSEAQANTNAFCYEENEQTVDASQKSGTVPSDSIKCLALLPVSTIFLLSVTVRVPKIILSGLFPANPNSPFNRGTQRRFPPKYTENTF